MPDWPYVKRSSPLTMRREIIIIFLSVFGLLSGQVSYAQKHETGFLDRSVALSGDPYRFQVYLPPDYTRKKKWPVILFLHGTGESGDDGILPTDHGIGTAIRRHRERFPAIVVFPQCRAKAVWFGTMEDQALRALDQSVREFNGDIQRIYLTGNSLGGYGTWQFAARHPGKFAAIAPVAGGIRPPEGFLMPAEIEKLAKKGDPFITIFLTNDPYAGVSRMIGRTPVWIFHGEKDERVPVTEARKMYQELKALGADVKYTEYANKGHGITETAYAEPDLPAWLLSHKLNKQR